MVLATPHLPGGHRPRHYPAENSVVAVGGLQQLVHSGHDVQGAGEGLRAMVGFSFQAESYHLSIPLKIDQTSAESVHRVAYSFGIGGSGVVRPFQVIAFQVFDRFGKIGKEDGRHYFFSGFLQRREPAQASQEQMNSP